MRRVMIGDLIAAAKVISASSDPADASQMLIRQADAAHRYAKRFGRPHPQWGNGSLMARALAMASPGSADLADPRMLDALARLCATLSVRRRRTGDP